jgi:hypothetical protein
VQNWLQNKGIDYVPKEDNPPNVHMADLSNDFGFFAKQNTEKGLKTFCEDLVKFG